MFISKEKDEQLRKGRVRRGNTVFTTRGTVGNAAYYGEKVTYDHIRINSGMVILNTKDSRIIDNEFVYYLVTSPIAKKTIELFCSGSAQPQLPIKDFVKIKYDLPALEEQKRIVAILSAYDDLIEVNNKRIKVLKQMAENLYKEWFVRFRFPGHETAEFENGIPSGWKVVKVKEIVKRLPFGKLYKEEDTDKEGKVIVIDQSQSEYVGFHNNEPSHIATSKNPIILFGDHSCKQQLMITPFSLSENVVPFVGKQNINTMYLYFLTNNLIETVEYKRHWTEFTAKKVLVAPSVLQECFVAKEIQFFEAIQTRKEQNRNLIKQRDLLLPRLMSGKLEVHP
jgi:type I restriction enzyme S subunit